MGTKYLSGKGKNVVIGGVKRSSECSHLIQDASCCPYISFLVVLLTLDQLWTVKTANGNNYNVLLLLIMVKH